MGNRRAGNGPDGAMRLLVTGPTGQLGHDVLLAALAAGHDPTPLPRHALDLALAADPRGGPRYVADALDRAAAAADSDDAAPAFDALIHCAAWTRVDDAESDPETAHALNAAAPSALAAECARRGARFVLISTDYVFDGLARRPYREEDPTNPLNVYGRSKLDGERLARTAHPTGTLIVRTASLFGRGGNFVRTMLRKGREEGRLRVVDDIVMSPTATADLAPAILALLEADADPGIYHLVNQGEASWYDFARAIVEEGQIDAAVEPVPASSFPTPATRPAYSVLDGGKAGALGIVMRPWREGLGDYLRREKNTLDTEGSDESEGTESFSGSSG
jgi:dTDP-4-dehydrorhamnose reductase